MVIKKSDEKSAETTAKILRDGGIAVLPTDTVYGFSGIIGVTGEKIRRIKGREESKPFITLISSPEEIFNHTDDKIPPEILEKWPGALTVIVHDKNDFNATTAFRCPGDEWLRRVIKLCGSPIYSTSVNRSGKPVLGTVAEIRREFEAAADLIVDDGDKTNALPSTLIALEAGKVKVLRQGDVRL